MQSGIHMRSWRSLGRLLRAWQKSHLPPQNFLLLHLLRAQATSDDDTDPTSNRTIPPQWELISPITSTRRTSFVPGKNRSENDALGTPARPFAHSGRTNTYTTYSNGHRKAPKSENAYKLLLHKVDWLLERLVTGL